MLYEVITGKNVKSISKMAEKFLVEYAWPGNIRELKNVIA